MRSTSSDESVRERRMTDDAPVTPPEPRPARRDAVLASTLNLVVGLWLVATPWIFGYDDGDAWWSPTVSGLLIASSAGGRLLGELSESVLARVNFAVGMWLILSALWLPPSAGAALNNATCGALVVLLSLLGIAASRALRRGAR